MTNAERNRKLKQAERQLASVRRKRDSVILRAEKKIERINRACEAKTRVVIQARDKELDKTQGLTEVLLNRVLSLRGEIA